MPKKLKLRTVRAQLKSGAPLNTEEAAGRGDVVASRQAQKPVRKTKETRNKNKLRKSRLRQNAADVALESAGADTRIETRPKKQESQRGSCFLVKSMVNDEWQTCLSAWKAVADAVFDLPSSERPFLRATTRVWAPFYYDGECKKHLTNSLGFRRVHHEPGEDFFEKVRDARFLEEVDLIWDNPPYTQPQMKQRVLEALVKANKPFCMLLPVAVLHSAFVREIEGIDMRKVQVLIPRRVWVKKKGQSPVPFKLLLWFCYGMGLQKDLAFLEDAVP
eukprot:g16119.t1